MQYLVILLLFIVMTVTISCNWHLQKNTISIPVEMKTMIFDSRISDALLDFAICKQLRLNGITLIKNSLYKNIPSLCILNSDLKKDIVSIFPDGQIVEYQMVLLLNISVSFPKGSVYPIKIRVYHSFFNKPYTALIKDTEQQTIINVMYNEAAEELIRKLCNIRRAKKMPAFIKSSCFLKI